MKRRIMFCCPEEYYKDVLIAKAKESKKLLALISETAYVLHCNGLVQVYVGAFTRGNFFNCLEDHDLTSKQFDKVENFLLTMVDIDKDKLFIVMREGSAGWSHGTLDCSTLGVTFPLIPPKVDQLVLKMIEHAHATDGNQFHTIVEGDRVTVVSDTWSFLNDNLRVLMMMMSYKNSHLTSGIKFTVAGNPLRLVYTIKYPFTYTNPNSSYTRNKPRHTGITNIDPFASEKADPEGYKALFDCKQNGDILEGFDMGSHMKYPVVSEECIDFDAWLWYTEDNGHQQEAYERICALLDSEKE